MLVFEKKFVGIDRFDVCIYLFGIKRPFMAFIHILTYHVSTKN